MLALALSACGASDSGQSETNEATTTSVLASDPSVPSTTTSVPQPAEPIAGVLLWGTDEDDATQCTLESLNVTSETVTHVATFPNHMGSCLTDPLQFSTTFDRIAVTDGSRGDSQAGWATSNGDFVQVGPDSTRSDFGLPTAPSSIGFDNHDNFYYEVEHGTMGNAEHFFEYFRVPPGQTGNGEFVGRVDSGGDMSFGELADGTLGLNPPNTCVPPVVSISNNPDQIVRADSCDANAPKVPITPNSSFGIDSLAISPDKSEVVFKTGNNKLFLVQAQGGEPKQIGVNALRPPAYYEIWAWI
ncbi:hypothetical protein [Mycobacterium sp. Root265]|uniref:hypothetical protein n=1 Tax=Mycobacterium sp. Root265 TaxID=1736504 RepID=UPI0012E39128|nr:hypothetical protein [Mycobacterium sp. Root265]